jgi:hypothetical protein
MATNSTNVNTRNKVENESCTPAAFAKYLGTDKAETYVHARADDAALQHAISSSFS